MAAYMQRPRIIFVLLFAICIGAFFIRAEGIKWPKLHPDESVIGVWLERSTHDVYIKDRVYPNGFFALTRPFVLAGHTLIRLNERFAYHCGAIDRIRGAKPDGIYFGRWFNVWAGTFLCVIVFLMVSRITCSRWGGLLAASLIGFTPYAVEHSHYAETDIAALLMLAVALWFWVIAQESGGRRWFLAAALTSGFAAGTKFTLTALVALVLVGSVLDGCRRPAAGWWKPLIKAVCFGILLFGAGFILANPAMLLDWKWFWAGMAAEKQRVFSETMLNLGPLGAQPGVKALHHLRLFCGNAATMGWPWLLLIIIGLPCAVIGKVRRYWPVLLMFPALYAVYWLFMAPWVRSQEFLFFLPSFAALAVLPLVALWRSQYFVGRVLVIIMALTAIMINGDNGLRVAGIFGWKDTRVQATEWLQTHLPSESRIAAESYAEAACPATFNPPASIRKIERDGISSLIEHGADYVLRAVSIGERGLRHPLTDELYAGAGKNMNDFMANSTLLRAWAPLPPQGLATFASPVIELYGLKHFAPAISLQAELPQPALIVNCNQNPAGRETFCPVGRRLGCAQALLVDRLPQTIAIGGPEELAQSVFLVLNTAERPAVIDVSGLGVKKKVALAPYDTCAVPLKRSSWLKCSGPFEKIILRAEPVAGVLYIPCYARIAFTVDEAVRIFLDTAREDKIADVFSKELLERELSPDLKYVLFARLGVQQPAGPAKLQIAGVRDRIEKALQAGPALVAINGVSAYYYDRFARTRLQWPYELSCGPRSEQYDRAPLQSADAIFELQLSEAQEADRRINQVPAGEYCQALPLPVLVPRGKHELRGEIMLRVEDTASGAGVPLTVIIAGENRPASVMQMEPGKKHNFSLCLNPGREIQPCLEFRAPAAVQVHLRNMELVWSLASALETLRDDLIAADLPPAAEQALEQHTTLARFPPWLALVGFHFDAGTREVKCVFEALRDHTPKLAVTFWIQRRGEWRRRQVQPLGLKNWLKKGERETAVIRLGTAFGALPDINKIGLGVETDVLWHPGALASAAGGYIIPFSGIMNSIKPDKADNKD